jgi:hypothetical protein
MKRLMPTTSSSLNKNKNRWCAGQIPNMTHVLPIFSKKILEIYFFCKVGLYELAWPASRGPGQIRDGTFIFIFIVIFIFLFYFNFNFMLFYLIFARVKFISFSLPFPFPFQSLIIL